MKLPTPPSKNNRPSSNKAKASRAARITSPRWSRSISHSTKAELASRDYLNALKTGDPEIISAYKERLQAANDEFLAAKREQEALNE